ncbi:hypothetical protein [Kineococcus sp. SYSU DK004]|uniref:hypothetical protein n=1 Tax=Kineococcus sp. SYSU DK004 TaxID=3383125 RepID=UPI003D7E35E6
MRRTTSPSPTTARRGSVLAGALLGALALAACGTDAGAGDDPATVTAPPPAITDGPATPSPPGAGPALPAPVDGTATRLLDALAAQDSAAAWAELAEPARTAWGGEDAFAQQASAYAEGLAAFADAERTWFPLGEDRGVLLLRGQVEREGLTEQDVFPLVLDGVAADGGDGAGAVLLPPAWPVGVELEDPAGLVAFAPAASTVTVLVDGAVVTAQEEPADGDRTRVSAPVPAGSQVVVVAAEPATGPPVAAAALLR